MKNVCRCILFLLFLAVLGASLNQMTLNRTSEGCIQLSDFYELPKHRVDVLCVGSSHVYYGINTCLLYDDYGIASYLLASPGQPMWISYYLLEEALKTQSPALVVFDIGTVFRKEDDFGAYSWETLISMKPSLSKWNAIQAVNQYEQCLDQVGAFFSFPYYHNRSAALTSQDFKKEERIRYNGYKPEFTVIATKELNKWEDEINRSQQEMWAEETGELGYQTGQEESETVSCLAKGPQEPSVSPDAITERAEHYLRKMIALCQDKEIMLLLVNSPFANQAKEKREAGRYIRMIAAEYDIPLLEGNYLIDEMQIDFAEDLLDASHLNYYGSVKYTNYLAQWMQEHCSLADRRQQEGYCVWEQESALFWERYGTQLAVRTPK